MELKPPECSTYPLTPCSEDDWKQCDRCGRLVCGIHDELLVIRHSGSHPNRGDSRMCRACAEFVYYKGEVMQSADGYEFVN